MKKGPRDWNMILLYVLSARFDASQISGCDGWGSSGKLEVVCLERRDLGQTTIIAVIILMLQFLVVGIYVWACCDNAGFQS